jgi:putative DNA primase/helicase
MSITNDRDGFDDFAEESISDRAKAFSDFAKRASRPDLDFNDVRAAALTNLDQLIDELIPPSTRGKEKAGEQWACNPTRRDNSPDSFSINTTTGLYNDFASKDSGDIFKLWRLVRGLADDTDALFAIGKFLGVPPRGVTGSTSRPAKPVDSNNVRPQRASPKPNKVKPPLGPIVATYDYTDLDGTVIYQVTRHDPKDFRQRRPDGNDGWIWSLGDKRVIYRWPEIAKYPDATVFVCEGEKDANRVAALGHCATTIAGDGQWTEDCVGALAGRDVVILEDNDNAGKEKALAAAMALHGKATTVRIVSLPDLAHKGDVSDWLDSDPANADILGDICMGTPEWEPQDDAADQAAADNDEQPRDANEAKPDNDLPIIDIKDGQLSALATRAEKLLIEAGVPLYQRGGTLVRPIIETVDASRGRKTKVAQLRVLDTVYLRDLMGRYAVWIKYDGRSKKMLATNPSSETAATVLARVGDWTFPAISGVISAPTMRPDGSLLLDQGHDEATGLLLVEPPLMPSIPDQPTKEDALKALALLDGLLTGFPFVDDVARAVALSAIMTPIVRGAFPVTPMHASRAPTAGSGKSFLWDIVAAIAIGQLMPVMSTGASEEETEKRLGAAMLAGQPLISIDNISSELGGDALCQIIERPVVEIRILGRSERVRIEARGTSMFATGNNFVVVGDVCRRVITVNLDPAMERPELRQFDFDPIEVILKDRGKYIAAVLAICRAYFVAGRPDKAPRLASFEGWSDTVRSALIWLGKADPVESMESARAEDPERVELMEMMQAWERVFGWNSSNRAKLSDVVLKGMAMTKPDHLSPPEPNYPDLYAALEAVAFKATGKRGQKPDARLLGDYLRRFKGRIIDGRRFAMRADPKGKKPAEWWVEDVRSPALEVRNAG